MFSVVISVSSLLRMSRVVNTVGSLNTGISVILLLVATSVASFEQVESGTSEVSEL